MNFEDCYLPIDTIDLIVTFTKTRFVATFILVCKRYEHLLSYKKYGTGEYFYYPLKETPLRDPLPECIDVMRMRAIWQNPFTKIPGRYDMIRYIPFEHPKFDLTLLRKSFLEDHKHEILLYQNSNSIRIHNVYALELHKISLNDLFHSYRYKVFVVSLKSSTIKSCANDIYNSCLYSLERLELLLANKILAKRWGRFLKLSDDVELYKRAYQIHVENGVNPRFADHVYADLLSQGKPMVEWLITHVNRPNIIKLGAEIMWNVDTVIYLYKSGYLSSNWIWTNIEHSKNRQSIINIISEEIPRPQVHFY